MFTQHSPTKTIAGFSCSGSDSVSLLKSGYFQKLLNFDVDLNSDPALELWGYQTTSSSLFKNLKQTFMEIKQKFYLVKDIAMGNFDCSKRDSDFCNIEILRIDILKIFHVFLCNLQKLQVKCTITVDDFTKNMVMQLTCEVKHLLICVGRISLIPNINTGLDFSINSNSCTYNFYHLCLDVWYNCLAILYVVHFSVPVDFKEIFCDFIEYSSAFLQVASFLVYDLSFLSINKYVHFYAQTNSPFICSCVKELWIMVIKLCDNFDLHSDKQTFWNLFLSDLQIILKRQSQDAKDESIDKFSVLNINNADSHKLIESCFWLTSHVSPLCKYNVFGHICEYEKNNSGSVGKYLIHNLLLNSEISEKHFRICLAHCIELSKLWGANADALFLLTDFYVKNIDKTFSIQEINLSCLFKDAKTWYIYIENLLNHITCGKETSFDYFLSILSLQLKLDKDNSLWRSLKGRIYSKFMAKKIKEMSETGLQNTFSLFHIIAISGQSEIVSKICETASVIETSTNPRKQSISWKALFVLLYINQTNKYDSEKITSLLSKMFNIACTDYSKISCDSIFKNNLMNLLLVYIDNMNELFKNSGGFSSTTYQLINSGFSYLLKSCNLSDQNYILGVILNLLLSIERILDSNNIDYIINNTECIRTLQLVFDNIYPFIENIVTTEIVPPVISNIAVILTKLAFTFSFAVNSSEFDYYKIFMFFACNNNVNSNICCHYLSLIFDYSHITEEIKVRSLDLDVLIFQSWLKCLINIQMEKKDLQELTKKVLHLPIVNELFPGFEISFETEDPFDMACDLFKGIGNDFSHRTMSEKIDQARKVQLCFKNYASVLANKIHNGKDARTFSHVYKLTAFLIENCSSVLHYRVSSESILLQILDMTVYPQILFPNDKTLQNLVSCAIKEYLPHILRGLFNLDYRKDKSVEREIRGIFTYYIEVLPLSINPLIKLFTGPYQKPVSLALNEGIFILETLKSNMLSNNIESKDTQRCIFRFYQEVLQKAPLAYKQIITSIILNCAMAIFMERSDPFVSDFMKAQIKNVLLYFKDKGMVSQSKEFLGPVIKWFIREKLQWSIVRGFTLLNLFVDHVPQVMLDLVGFFNESIEILENSRGVGEDKILRNEFQNLIAKLQLKLRTS